LRLAGFAVQGSSKNETVCYLLANCFEEINKEKVPSPPPTISVPALSAGEFFPYRLRLAVFSPVFPFNQEVDKTPMAVVVSIVQMLPQ